MQLTPDWARPLHLVWSPDTHTDTHRVAPDFYSFDVIKHHVVRHIHVWYWVYTQIDDRISILGGTKLLLFLYILYIFFLQTCVYSHAFCFGNYLAE